MRILPLILCLAVTPLDASEWLTSAKISGLERLQAADRQRITPLINHTYAIYAFENADLGWKIHRGDLKIQGNFDNGGALVVDGNLEIQGSYDDHSTGSGTLIVLGDLKAEQVLTWGDLYVRGRLEARGLIYGYYNDFSMRVDGSVDARGIVIFDHTADYKRGKVGFRLHDSGTIGDADFEAALRQLEPEILADISDLELEESSDLESLFPSYEAVTRLVRAGRPVFRAQPAAPSLIADLRVAVDFKTPTAKLLPLVGRDPLVDLVLAARPEVERPLIDALIARRDPGVKAWLARFVTDPAALDGPLTAEIAAQMVANPETPDQTLMKIAEAKDPEIRSTLSQRDDLPIAIVARIAKDPDPDVRALVLGFSGNAHRLPPAEQARLARDPDARVRAAMAWTDLDAATLAHLVADPAEDVRWALASSLAARIDRPSSRASLAEREKAAFALLEKGGDGIVRQIGPALPTDKLVEFYRDGRKLDWPDIAQATRSVALMTLLADANHLEILGSLARNLALPVDLQLKIVERAKKPESCEKCWSHDNTDDVLESLFGNANVAPAALMAVVPMALERPDASFINSLTDCHHMPQEVIELLDARWAGGEEWSLAVILMRHSTRKALERALPRWYEEDAVKQALARMRRLDDPSWWRTLGTSEIAELRETAARNVNTPTDLLLKLLNDDDEDTARGACWNPALPKIAAFASKKGLEAAIGCQNQLSLEELTRQIHEAPTEKLRDQAFEAYQVRKLRAW